MRSSPERGYFVLACVWSGRWADSERCSRIGACAFLCVFAWHKYCVFLCMNTLLLCRKVVFVMYKHVTCCGQVVFFIHEQIRVMWTIIVCFYTWTYYFCLRKMLMHIKNNIMFYRAVTFLCMDIILFDHTSVRRPPGLAGEKRAHFENGFAQVWRAKKGHI